MAPAIFRRSESSAAAGLALEASTAMLLVPARRIAQRPLFERQSAAIMVNGGLSRRAPDAAQRAASSAAWCAAEPGPLRAPVFGTVPALRSGIRMPQRV